MLASNNCVQFIVDLLEALDCRKMTGPGREYMEHGVEESHYSISIENTWLGELDRI